MKQLIDTHFNFGKLTNCITDFANLAVLQRARYTLHHIIVSVCFNFTLHYCLRLLLLLSLSATDPPDDHVTVGYNLTTPTLPSTSHAPTTISTTLSDESSGCENCSTLGKTNLQSCRRYSEDDAYTCRYASLILHKPYYRVNSIHNYLCMKINNYLPTNIMLYSGMKQSPPYST